MNERARVTEGTLLWEPSAEFRDASTMTDYMRWLERERGLQFEDFEAFWSSIVEYYDIPVRGRWDRVLADRTMPGAVWFEGAELNYAETLIRRLDPDGPALLYASEREG